MAQETTNNPRNDCTMTGKKSNGKLTLSINLADNNSASSDVDNCINHIKRLEKEDAIKTSK